MSIKDKYRVRRIKHSECNEWLIYKHYAKRVPSISFAFGLYSDKLEGICTYGKPASYTLCEGICGKEHSHAVYELNRLCINEGLEKNVLSYFVSCTFGFLRTGFILVSYADPNNYHTGYIYQATNWIYTGLSSREKVYFLEDGTIVSIADI